jgi:hypothetical protein
MEIVRQFVNYITHDASPELSYYCLVLNYDDADDGIRMRLLNVIINDTTDKGNEFSIKLLRDQPNLTAGARNALLEHLVDLGDKTSCSRALTVVPDLGSWERRLRDVLDN